MRRTDHEFKAEVLRRAEQYRAERKKRARRTLLVCLPLLLCCGGVLAVFSTGFGGSTKSVSYDSVMSAECMDIAPAAPASESVEEESAFQADMSKNEPAQGREEPKSSGTVLSITVTTWLAGTETAEVQLYASAEKTAAILEEIDRFGKDPQTVIGDDSIGDSEGMAYVIRVITDTGDQEYVLFNDALLMDGTWYVNTGCYQTLEAMILQEDD